MDDYKKLYTQLFNAATDALNALEKLDVVQAHKILRQAQIAAEEQYLLETEKEPRLSNHDDHET